MNKLFQVGFFFIFLLVTSCERGWENTPVSNNEKVDISGMKCYASFEEFAYVFPESSNRAFDPLLPTAPWELEVAFPDELMGNYHIGGLGIEVMFTRSVNQNLEIWLARPMRYLKEDIKSILIYRPEIKKWQYVADIVKGTDIFISKIYLTSDGTVWGLNTWGGDNTNPHRGPVLSKFNEQTQEFEFATGVLEIPFTYDQQFVNLEVILDPQDVFWFLLANDGIYRYEPTIQKTTKQVNLQDIDAALATLSIDGSIYFEDLTYKKLILADPMFSIDEGMLHQFIPGTGELIQLDIPDEPWPQGKMYVTRTGQLWVGANGYRDIANGSWHLLHPDPDTYFDMGFWAYSPSIMLESSNGLLWFNKYTDYDNGTAWYNPGTGEGCMFTNIRTNIVEDSQQQLWMFADGKLYRYSLEQ